MTKSIILVKICYKLLYVIQGVKNIFNFLASADVKVFGRTCLFAMLLLIGLALFISRVFLFSIVILWVPSRIVIIITLLEVSLSVRHIVIM